MTATRLSGLLSRRNAMILAGLIVVGLAIRVVWAFSTRGVQYDIDSLQITAQALHPGGTGVYDGVRWPYPGGFLPLLAACDWLAGTLGLDFTGVVQLPAIVADLALAALVLVALRWQGVSERRALFGAGLVALGPSFIAISGYHGQIDSVAALPAFAGALLWTRDGARRAVVAGLLIGLGASVKQPVIFTVLALLPTGRTWRERGILLAAAAIVPIVSIAPFLIGSAHQVLEAMRQNSGVPGFGGLSAFVQPDLTRHWALLDGPTPAASSATLKLIDAQRVLVAGGAVVAAALLWRRRVPALHAASFIWLVVFVVNPNFSYQYLIWGLPFFIAAGYLEAVAVFQVAIVPAMLWLYWRPGLDPGGWAYFVSIQLVWAGLIAALVVGIRKLMRGELPSERLTPAGP